MTATQHPLTETDAAGLWDGYLSDDHGVWHRQDYTRKARAVDALRAAFDAGREHEREHAPQDRPAEVTTEAIRREVEYAVRTAAAHGYAKGKWGEDRSEPIQALIKSASAALTAALAAALAVATPADPRHDPRPWQDCTRADIREGDLVEGSPSDRLIIGVAHHQNEYGNWCTEDGYLLTLGDLWPLRRIPAHTAEMETPMSETTTPAITEPLARTLLGVPEGYGAPHHDAGQVKADDYVMQLDKDGFIRSGRAHHQSEDGDWFAEDGSWITWADRRADRPDALTVWPAPTPPAEEVELPGEGQETSRTNGIVVTVYDSNPNSYQPVHVPGQIRINGRRVYVTPGGFTVSTDERGTPIVTLSFRPAELRFIQEGEK